LLNPSSFTSKALLPLEEVEYFRKNKRTMTKQEYGVWVADNRYGVKRSPFLVLGSKDTMKREFVIFSTTVAVWVDGDSLLPYIVVCLVCKAGQIIT
jgi:hypothetical protein